MSTDLPTAVREILSGRLTPARYVRSLRGPIESAIFAYDDPLQVTAAFNPQYLSDGLTVAVGDRVRVEVRDGLKPALVKGEAEGFLYLVMPVRLPAHVGAPG